jgi:serpin B
MQSFGTELLKWECAARPKQNVFVSPLSVFLALAMAENGAGAETKTAIRKVLQLPAAAEARELNQAAKHLLEALGSKGGIELSIGNALWMDGQAPLAPEFVGLCSEFFDAVAQTLNMKDPASAAVINNWIAEKTRGKISAMVDPMSLAAMTSVITNAVYFKGRFQFPFRKEATQPKPFHLANGRVKQVLMMHKTGAGAQYRRGDRCEAVALRYAGPEEKGPYAASEVELILALPDKGTSPEAILGGHLSALFQNPSEWIEVELYTPRFRLDFESRLNESLREMGMGIAMKFPGANFTPMGSDLFFIDTVLHKTRLEVDEEGTTAAATRLGVTLGRAMIRREPKRKVLVFDRPFAVLLRDAEDGALLFAGIVYEP